MSKKKIIDTYFVSIGDFKFGILETLSNLADVKGVALDKWLNFFRYYEKNESLCIFVAKEFTESKTGTESQVIGAITVFIEPKLIHNCSFVCHIEDVVVRKGYENKGIGKILMKLKSLLVILSGLVGIVLNFNYMI